MVDIKLLFWFVMRGFFDDVIMFFFVVGFVYGSVF